MSVGKETGVQALESIDTESKIALGNLWYDSEW